MIKRLAGAINYPEQVADRESVHAFRVDGGVCFAEMIGGRLILRRVLEVPEEEVTRFAGYAAGRLLREEAVLAWDERAEQLMLWQEMPMQGSAAEIAAAFEDFCDSYDWWLQRVNDLQAPPTVFPDILIKP